MGEGAEFSLLDRKPIPSEKVRAEFRRKPGLAEGAGGAGMSLYRLCTLRSDRASTEDGLVDTLSREDEAALS